MRDIFCSSFARTVSVHSGADTVSARAFIRPADAENPERPTASPAGLTDGRRWLLILEPMELSGPVEITDGDRTYVLLRRELIGNGSHIEGVLCLKAGGADA